MTPLHVASFGGGVVTEGAASTRKIDELLVADAFDIGPRGALVCASDATDYVELRGNAVPGVPWQRLFQLGTFASPAYDRGIALGAGLDAVGDLRYLLAQFARAGATSPINGVHQVQIVPAPWNGGILPPVNPSPVPEGVIVTTLPFPGMFAVTGPTQRVALSLVNIGAREGYAAIRGAGLYVLMGAPPAIEAILYAIDRYDALGTGERGIFPGGTNSKQLRFRGIGVYGAFALGWGYDAADTIYNEGPGRLMFANVGTPLTWGNTGATAVTSDVAFADTDAIIIGDGGERIRAGYNIFGKYYLGTSRGLHFLQGYGRDSFLTNGSIPVMKAFNVVGPRALIEGPDRKLYGVGDQGLWAFDGYNPPEPIFQKVRDYAGASRGYFDCIWQDLAGAGYPGTTNGDLVWMAVDYLRQQVLVGIPFCDATAGEGVGNDTVIIRYHVHSAGFTRQVFPGVNYTCAGYFRGEGQSPDTRFMGTPTGTTAGATCRVRRYAYQSVPSVLPVMPAPLPQASFGPYIPFGADGQGVVRRAYLTLSWAAVSALPIVFRIRTTSDDVIVNDYLLTIATTAPVAPTDGDCWLDTSNTDASIGNARGGVGIVAAGGFLLKTWNSGTWQVIAGQGGVGRRAAIQLPLTRREGTYVTITADCTTASAPFQLEGLGLSPGAGTPDA